MKLDRSRNSYRTSVNFSQKTAPGYYRIKNLSYVLCTTNRSKHSNNRWGHVNRHPYFIKYREDRSILRALEREFYTEDNSFNYKTIRTTLYLLRKLSYGLNKDEIRLINLQIYLVILLISISIEKTQKIYESEWYSTLLRSADSSEVKRLAEAQLSFIRILKSEAL